MSRDFSSPIFFIKQLLLVTINMPTNDLEFYRITPQMFDYVWNHFQVCLLGQGEAVWRKSWNQKNLVTLSLYLVPGIFTLNFKCIVHCRTCFALSSLFSLGLVGLFSPWNPRELVPCKLVLTFLWIIHYWTVLTLNSLFNSCFVGLSQPELLVWLVLDLLA